MSAVAEDVRLLLILGKILDRKAGKYGTIRELLIRAWLLVRNKSGRLVPLHANRAQRQFERTRGRRNIVLKARQLGISTWIAARFFMNTITRPGTVTVQVAHDQTSAEEIFRIVHRFLENLPAKSGGDKKEAALSFIGSALSVTEALTNRDIVDEGKFKDGLSKIIDGTVQCLNASAWAKK